MAALPVQYGEKNCLVKNKKKSVITYKTISLAKDKYSNITVILILMFSKVISMKSMTEMQLFAYAIRTVSLIQLNI